MRTVVQHVTVQVGADDLENLFLELVAFLVQFDEIELLADGLEGFGKLGVEQLELSTPAGNPATGRP